MDDTVDVDTAYVQNIQRPPSHASVHFLSPPSLIPSQSRIHKTLYLCADLQIIPNSISHSDFDAVVDTPAPPQEGVVPPPPTPPSAGWKAVLAFYIMLITMVLFQSFIVWAKKEHPRRYLQVTLVGLWLVPPCLALSRYCSVRFPPHPPPTLAPTPRSTPRSTPSNPHPVTHTQ